MDSELYHYGVKGMKWGVRRTPAQLGHDTGGSKKKQKSGSDDSGTAKKKSGRSSESNQNKTSSSTGRNTLKELQGKSLNDMSDAELQQYFNRVNTQRNIMTAQQQISQMQPQKVNKGRQFVSNTVKNVVMPAAQNAARDYLQKTLREALGLDKSDVDSLKALRDEVDRLNLTNKKMLYEDQIAERRAKRNAAKKGDSGSSKKDDDSSSTSENSRTSNSSTSNSSKGDGGSSKKDDSSPSKLEISRTSNSNTSNSSRRNRDDDVIEVDYYQVDGVPYGSGPRGYRYVNQNKLLGRSINELPSGDDERRRR